MQDMIFISDPLPTRYTNSRISVGRCTDNIQMCCWSVVARNQVIYHISIERVFVTSLLSSSYSVDYFNRRHSFLGYPFID